MIDPKRVDTCGRLGAALLAVVFAALVSHKVVQPFLTSGRHVGAFREAVQVLSAGESDVDRLDAEIRAVAQEIAASEARLPTDPNLDVFLERLGEMGRKSRIRLERLTPGDVEEHLLYSELKIDVRVTGPFTAVYDFLLRLENADQLSRIEQLKIANSEPRGPCAADMRLALYFAPETEG
ncbi:MAG: type 4a pilus biogenesis protein PilO [Candidatus Eisenbacteria sp.]|nr:type 4a pilus biogenesis protein PilO [Candidatus Eisenbacteria bacterium]